MVKKETDLRQKEQEVESRKQAVEKLEAAGYTKAAELEARTKYINQQEEELRSKASQIKTLIG